MKISVLQLDITWESPCDNIRKVTQLTGSLDSDLIVLPEMWGTGFSMNPLSIANEEDESDCLKWMKKTSQEKKCALCGSLAIKAFDGSFRNRLYFTTPNDVFYYDKHHLFTHGHENKFYTKGEETVIVAYRGFRFLLQTCYDLRFPVFSRYGRAGAYDAIIYVANWPESRRQAWDILTRARAIENQCFVIAANRTGEDPICHYNGGSVVIDPLGNQLANYTNNKSMCHAEISKDTLIRMRDRFKVLDDRDIFI